LCRLLFRTPAGFRLVRRSSSSIARCHTNLKLNDLIPLRIAAITLGDSQEIPEPTARIHVFYYVFYFAHSAIMAYTGRIIQLRKR
jgi:hypothetical protein